MRNALKKVPAWAWYAFLVSVLVYLAFMSGRMARFAGDEKVYVSTAFEMIRNGNWFLQTLNGDPDYYKGPLHYLWMHASFYLFGYSMVSTLFMNWVYVLILSLSVGGIARSHAPKNTLKALQASAFALTAVGVYSTVFTSQMETSLIAFYALAAFCLDRTERGGSSLWFWIVAGLSGWSKSPLHSALLACSGFLFWFLSSSLERRAKDGKEWLHLGIGIFVGIAGYLPMLLLDFEPFYRTYVLRELVNRPGAGEPIYMLLLPLSTFWLFPWFFTFLQTALESARSGFKRADRGLLVLACSIFIPTFLFFASYHFRFSNYTLPVIVSVVLLFVSFPDSQTRIVSFPWGRVCDGFLLVLIGCVFAWIVHAFEAERFWLKPASSVLACVLMISAGLALAVGSGFPRLSERMRVWIEITARPVFWIGFAIVATMIGEREMIDIRAELRSSKAPVERVWYLNLGRHIWSEWGYLNFMIPHPVLPIVSNDQLKRIAEQAPGFIAIADDPKSEQVRLVVNELTREKDASSRGLVVKGWMRWEKPVELRNPEKRIQARRTCSLRPFERQYTLIHWDQ